ncbi:hypothetical protein Gogos_022287 [Gossypium gossypioides]|uniref:Uncharacterized protein n=1 Tax=Gossypium gossypioides TaxID=34282 RepID=A0A7J9D6N2_GOSGO|nr:hypothetical protein [Gossypium gossypioides]MBA0756397.1 hypothetical protein [Gossypium gossypioides]MBA0756398.1 hypothetical protein [Gossypium gossypioides]
MSEQWVAARIKQKGDNKCIPWKSLKDLILTHPDVRKRVDVFALSIYGLVVFPKPWDMLMKQLSIYLTSLIRGLHQSRRFWQKLSGH